MPRQTRTPTSEAGFTVPASTCEWVQTVERRPLVDGWGWIPHRELCVRPEKHFAVDGGGVCRFGIPGLGDSETMCPRRQASRQISPKAWEWEPQSAADGGSTWLARARRKATRNARPVDCRAVPDRSRAKTRSWDLCIRSVAFKGAPAAHARFDRLVTADG